MTTVTLAAKEFAEKTGVDYQISLAALKFLEAKGVVTRGEKKITEGRQFGMAAGTFIIPVGEITMELIPVPVNSES
jgi:hypothetical protein